VYRDRLRAASPGVGFIFLDGSRAVIAERMAQRRHPYMPASLLDSQLQTLERPGADEPDVLQLPIDQALDALVQQALAALYATAPAAAEPSPRGAA
jgi:carbohydrate kinase (thermoresistant glucokinase family)